MKAHSANLVVPSTAAFTDAARRLGDNEARNPLLGDRPVTALEKTPYASSASTTRANGSSFPTGIDATSNERLIHRLS